MYKVSRIFKGFLSRQVYKYNIFINVYACRERNSVTLRGHSSTVCSVAFVPNTNVLLSTSHDTTMRGWNLKTQTPIALYRYRKYCFIWKIVNKNSQRYWMSIGVDLVF